MRAEVVNAEAEAARRVRGGIALALLGVMALSLGTELALGEVLGLPILLLLLPTVSLAQLPLVRAHPLERIPVYLGSMAAIGAIGTLSLLLGLRLGGPAAIGLRPLPPGSFLGWTAALTLAGLALLLLGRPWRPLPEGEWDFVDRLLPRTREERWSFAALSATAGIGEEVAYRGYVLAALQLLPIGPWGAAVVSSLAFGVLHAYQGGWGILRTGVVGMVFAGGVLATGSLLPAMAAHTLVDLVAGLLLGPRWRRASDDGGTPPQTGPERDPAPLPPPLDPPPPVG